MNQREALIQSHQIKHADNLAELITIIDTVSSYGYEDVLVTIPIDSQQLLSQKLGALGFRTKQVGNQNPIFKNVSIKIIWGL